MQVQVLVPIALKPQPMLQSVVQGAPVFASELVQLASFDEPVIEVPPEPLTGDPPVPDPPAPAVVVDDSPPAPAVVDGPPVVVWPVPVVVEDDVPVDPVPVVEVPPPEPLTPDPLLPLSVLLEQPEGTQR
jgi:hypothetical protein